MIERLVLLYKRTIKLPSSDISTVGVQLNQDDVSEFFSFEQPSYNYYEFISGFGLRLLHILIYNF